MQINSNKKENPLYVNETKTTHVNSGEIGVESYGKFKDKEGLLNAYNSLQAEFTRRCQRVKELERELKQVKTNVSVLTNADVDDNENFVTKNSVISAQTDTINKEVLGEQIDASNEVNDETKRKIIREYLNNIKSSKPEISLVSGNGSAIIAPPSKPKNILQAGELAMKILSNKEIN